MYFCANVKELRVNQQNSPQTMEMATTPDDRYVVVLKVGGNELDDDTFLYGLAQAVRSLQEGGKQPVIVHGGGKAIADLQTKLGLKTQFLDGLRITSDADVDVVEMVLSGLINKRIVRALLSEHIQAAGISGVDNATVYVEKMWHPAGDLGRVRNLVQAGGDLQGLVPHLGPVLDGGAHVTQDPVQALQQRRPCGVGDAVDFPGDPRLHV